MCKEYKLVATYVAMDKKHVTHQTCVDRLCVLNRMLAMLEESYGVVVTDDMIEGLNNRVLNQLYLDLQETRKNTTTNHYVVTLNPFLRWLVKNWYIDYDKSDPAGVAKMQSLPNILTSRGSGRKPTPDEVEKEKRKYYSKEQTSNLLHSQVGYNHVRDACIIALALYSGLRTSEICSMTIGSILDYPKGETCVRRKGGEWCHVVIGERFYPYFDAYMQQRSDKDDHSRPLFLTTRGTPCNRRQICAAISRKQSAVGGATGLHALRHTFGSDAEKIGGAGIARDALNHKSLVVTNRYDHTTVEQRKAAVSLMNYD